MANVNCFHVLQVPETASVEELRRAYMRLVRRWHPDQYVDAPGLQAAAQERLKLINAAYEEAKAIRAASAHPGRQAGPAGKKSGRRSGTGFPGWLRGLFGTGKVLKRRPAMDSRTKPRPGQARAGGDKNFEAIFQDAVRARPAAPGGAALRPRPRPTVKYRGGRMRGRRTGAMGDRERLRVEPIRRVQRVDKV
jgi:curved DNA-binding protein CbpA